MLVSFKNTETKLKTSGATEQKLFKNGESVGWLLSITVTDTLSANELDELLTLENIGEISLYNVNDSSDEQGTSLIAKFTGYEKLTSCLLRYADNKQSIDIQLTKGV